MFNYRYYMDQDNDCHWYLIPAWMRSQFDAWVTTETEDPPEGIRRIKGSPAYVTFENVEEE